MTDMAFPPEGAKGRVKGGPFGGFPAAVKGVTADEGLQVAVDVFGRTTDIVIAPADFVPEGEKPEVSAACPYRVNDAVVLSGHWREEKRDWVAIVLDVDEANRRLTVTPEGSTEKETLEFRHVTPVRSRQGDLLENYVRALRSKYGRPSRQKELDLWAVRQLRGAAWDPYHPMLSRSSALAREYEALETSLWERSEEALRREERELRETFEPLSDDEKVALWMKARARWLARDSASEWTPEENAEYAEATTSTRRYAIFTLRGRLGKRVWDFNRPSSAEVPENPDAAEDDAYEAWRATHDATPVCELQNVADAALAAAFERFPAVSAHFEKIYGLRLPRHVAVARAFFDVAGRLRDWDENEPELRFDVLRSSFGLSEGYLLDLFQPGALERQVKPGLDERFALRRFGNPPEMVSVMLGNFDGQHWGLWFDDPRFVPSMVVHMYTNDAPVVYEGERSVLAEIFKNLEEPETSEDERRETRFRRRLLREYAHSFADADRRALEEDSALMCPYARTRRLWGDLPGVAAPEDLLDNLPDDLGVNSSDFEARLTEHVAAARAALDKGRPVYALALGRILHVYRHKVDPAIVDALLIDAYRTLHREALAEIARVHRALRADHECSAVFVSA